MRTPKQPVSKSSGKEGRESREWDEKEHAEKMLKEYTLFAQVRVMAMLFERGVEGPTRDIKRLPLRTAGSVIWPLGMTSSVQRCV